MYITYTRTKMKGLSAAGFPEKRERYFCKTRNPIKALGSRPEGIGDMEHSMCSQEIYLRIGAGSRAGSIGRPGICGRESKPGCRSASVGI